MASATLHQEAMGSFHNQFQSYRHYEINIHTIHDTHTLLTIHEYLRPGRAPPNSECKKGSYMTWHTHDQMSNSVEFQQPSRAHKWNGESNISFHESVPLTSAVHHKHKLSDSCL